jgi:hypothetical protein
LKITKIITIPLRLKAEGIELRNHLGLEAQGENSKHTHWCEGEDLEEHLEQEQEPEEEELQ